MWKKRGERLESRIECEGERKARTRARTPEDAVASFF